MHGEKIPVQKLILLSITGQAPGIRRSRLRDAALASLSMDYFEAVRSLDELVRSGLIRVAIHGDEPVLDAEDREVERCDLTEKGRITLDTLENQIPAPTRRFLSAYLDETYLQRSEADSITAVVEATPDGYFRLSCRQLDGDECDFSFSLLFPTETMARKAAATWKEKPASVFASLIDSLVGDDKKSP